MKRIKLIINLVILFALLTSACIGQTTDQIADAPQLADTAQPLVTAQPGDDQPKAAPTQQPQPTAPAAGGQAVLLFGIGMHIEPFGSVPSELVGGETRPKPQGTKPADKSNPDYNQLPFFNRHVENIATVAEIIEQHGGRMTVQAQTPFTQMAVANENTILADLAQDGHEMALHFHENAHMGNNSEGLPVETWCAVMQEEINLVKQASGVDRLRYWSGGNLYPGIFEAAACAGLDVNSDWKNPDTQSTPT